MVYLKIGTLRSDNVDVHENVTSTSMKSPTSKAREKRPGDEVGLELKRGARSREFRQRW